MFFFKSKQKAEELLPPPPPFPTLDFEEESKDKADSFEEIDKQEESSVTSPRINRIKGLLEDLDEETKPKKSSSNKTEKSVLKKELVINEKKLPKKEKSAPKIKTKEPKKTKTTKIPEVEEDFESKGIDFELPKDLDIWHETEFPANLDQIDDIKFNDIGEIGKTDQQEFQKPKEVLEAQEEIKSAIEKIKQQENPSFFKRLFFKRKTEDKINKASEPFLAVVEKSSRQEIKPIVDSITAIQHTINTARDALMRFDLETAKRDYIEIMKIYNKLNPKEQAKVYHDVNELYFERKSAEELKV